MPLTVRVDQKNRTIDPTAGPQRGRSKSDVIRDAIGVLAKQEQEQEKTGRHYEAARDLIGSVHGGPPNLSEQTGDRFRKMLTRPVAPELGLVNVVQPSHQA